MLIRIDDSYTIAATGIYDWAVAHPFYLSTFLGMVGGIGNSLLLDHGLQIPKKIKVKGTSIWMPGFLGNLFWGAVAAVVTYALQDAMVFGKREIGIAILSGIGGSSALIAFMQKQEIRVLGTKNDALSKTIREVAKPK